jgi:hypothetical protein
MRVYRHREKMWVEINRCMLASFDEIEELVDGVHSLWLRFTGLPIASRKTALLPPRGVYWRHGLENGIRHLKSNGMPHDQQDEFLDLSTNYGDARADASSP